ncbi:chitotriosidase-1 isoform 2 [Moniliophthora roreri MCA 2997]|uniref:Chitotriosidase-1 isoform 2 n=1 Tax=Moniliophthora roreri (strain MCA 2997) TaxID=1381753 RepID=V2WY17_MONRO|nr:chitotriosidase-1 isoform 2 [Moniliophthora roreri MCA 2997]
MHLTMRLPLLQIIFFVSTAYSQSCGSQNNGALCEKGCCSQYGFCGTTADFCLTSKRCQSQCINDGPPPPPAGPEPPEIDTSKLFRPPSSTFANKELVGYFSNWAQYRGLDPSVPSCEKEKSFLPEHINPFLYTHLNYAFVFMANNNSVIPHEYDDLDLSMRFNKWVKGLNPSVTTSFSVGGWSMNDGPSRYTGGIDYSTFFSQMAASAAGRATFIDSCIAWARDLGFDGIDIDWEYVGDPDRGGGPADTENFTLLVKEMRDKVREDAASSGKRELLITVAAPADPDKFALIQGKAVSDYIDWYNLMTYDFYGNWDNRMEAQAPIADTLQAGWSFTSAIDMYLEAGVPANKINAGIPLYGRVWTMDDPSCTSPGCTGSAGVSGRCTAENGYLSYFEIKEIMDTLGDQNMLQTSVNFVLQDGYYMVFDNQWVGFDDENSFQAKVDIINSRGLRGGMLWAVDLDTPESDLTRKLLSYYQSCPRDGEWPATSANSEAELPCGLESDFPEEVQTRKCNSDLTWGSVDNASCKRQRPLSLAAQKCVE